jgi:hydroxymethylpyrimidine pyrophosphatase-like HAD family hydrolase
VFFVALATDYDGTLAHNGKVDDDTVEALGKLKASGRKSILVTGRELADLERAFARLDAFDLIVCENGALLFDPADKKETPLADPPPAALIERLGALGVTPLSVGRAIIATWEPNETLVLEAIRELGLEQQIIFNKGAVMVLPSGVNKATGLQRALKQMHLSAHNVVGIGDAENDLAFLGSCGCAAAVENALDSVKSAADLVVADHGAGVAELIDMLTRTDLAEAQTGVGKVQPVLGHRADGTPLRLTLLETVLIIGDSGRGKSTLVTALLEQMRDAALQFCILDPEGDYSELRDCIVIGDRKNEPGVAETVELLAQPSSSVVLNLMAIEPAERPRFLIEFLPEIAKLRAQTGRPHWIVLEEAHHFLPARWQPVSALLPKILPATIAVTVHADQVARAFLDLVSTVVGVGDRAAAAIDGFCRAAGRPAVAGPRRKPGRHEIEVLRPSKGVEVIDAVRPKEKLRRHFRKYAEGQLGADKSFYFRGPEGALNLRAENLTTFLSLAGGVDDRTWLHHLRRGDYSAWFRDAVRDDGLAAEASVVEQDASLSAADSRARIAAAVEAKYAPPARNA